MDTHSRRTFTLVFLVGLATLAISLHQYQLAPGKRPQTAGSIETTALAALRQQRPFLFFQAIAINKAAAEQLTVVPGIGPELSRRIIIFRQKNGPFTSLADLEKVRGIGPAKMASLRAYCRL